MSLLEGVLLRLREFCCFLLGLRSSSSSSSLLVSMFVCGIWVSDVFA